VLCGVTVLSADHKLRDFGAPGPDRRPPGRVWLIRTAARFGLALAGTALVLVPSVVRMAQGQQRNGTPLTLLLRDPLVGHLTTEDLYWGMWLPYGFAVGALCGLLFRRRLVAGLVAVTVGGLAAGMWVPSLLNGGLRGWQVAGVPLLALVASRLLLPAWLEGRLASRPVFAKAAVVLTLAALWLGGALGYRLAEVPPGDDRLDMDAYVECLSPDPGPGGRLTRAACDNLAARLRQLSTGDSLGRPFPDQVAGVLLRGWPPDDRQLSTWLDRVFDDIWAEQLAKAAAQPPGTVEDRVGLTWASERPRLATAREAGRLLAARGLRQQARGDDEDFVAELAIGLALARSLRFQADLTAAHAAANAEIGLRIGLERWLGRLDGRPDLLRQALALLLRHEAEADDDPRDILRADYLLAQNTLENPVAALVERTNRYAKPGDLRTTPGRATAVASLLRAPWEHERNRRLLRYVYEEGPRKRTYRHAWDCWVTRFHHLGLEKLAGERRDHLVGLRAAQLQVALRLYQAEKDRPARSLEDLVPAILPAVPADPYDGQPFRYRLSAGESLEWPREWVAGHEGPPGPGEPDHLPIVLAPGRGILWSVGEDRADDGGRKQGRTERWNRGEDQIFLVPLPPAE
jgi:hypothetical protein